MQLYKFTRVQLWKMLEYGKSFEEILVLKEIIFLREVNKVLRKA